MGSAVTSDRDSAVRMYSVTQLADLWGIGKTFIYDEIAEGRLPTVQLGNGDRNKLRIRARDAEAWIEQRTTTTTAR